MNILTVMKKDRNLKTAIMVATVSYTNCKRTGLFQDYCGLSSKVTMLLILCDALIASGKIDYDDKYYVLDVMSAMERACFKCCNKFC